MAAYAAHTTNTHLLTAKKKQKNKSHTFWKMEVKGKTSQQNGPKVEKDKTESATGLGRGTKEKI